MCEIIINGETFKQIRFNKNYYISIDGKVYSTHAQTIIKTPINTVNGKNYKRVDIYFKGKQRHFVIHRLVYDTWVEPIDRTCQINHKDDNSLNNHVSNLYKGTQKENIKYCVKNGHRVGSIFYVTLFDKKVNKIITFAPASKFIEYSGHPAQNKGISRMFTRNWFKKRYTIIEKGRIKDRFHLKSVTTKADECKPVDMNLSHIEARG